MHGLRSIAFLSFLIFLSTHSFAQIDSLSNFESDLERPSTDSSYIVSQDTTVSKADSVSKQKKGDIETTINYNAKDSMYYDLKNRKIYMYKEAHIDYGDIELDADQTIVDWNERTIKADYSTDSLGKKVGKPVFTQEGKVYETDDILYNFKTKRAIIKGVVTEQDGAYMHGEDVKMNEQKELFIKGAKYTTCNLGDPHFFIESDKLKVIPGNKVVSGPFNLKFREIPTPLWFPFGMFPQPRKKATGIVFPSYGEEKQRGFFLRDGGYYFAFSDYMDLRLTGDIYSRGGHALEANTNYKKRYAFSGSLNFSYNKNVTSNAEDPTENNVSNDFWLRWNHRPETRGNSSFGASVSLGTQSYNSNNNLVNQDFSRSINSQFASNVSYSQRFQNIPFNLNANLRHSQNIQTGIVNMTLPDFSMNMNRIYPLKKVITNQKNPLAKISFSHNFVAKNELTNAPQRGLSGVNVTNEDISNQDTIDFNPSNFDRLMERAKISGKHSIPLSTSFNLFNYLTVSPSINYTDLWFTKELDFSYDEEAQGVRIDTVQGFSRTGFWSSSASVNTRFYGTVIFPGKDKKIQAIRHVITPSVSFSYNPDFSESSGVYKEIQVDSLGNTRRFSRYEGFTYGNSIPSGESRTISFSLQNNLEMKVRDDKDSTQEFKKVKIFDNLSINSGYNLAADSFKLSNINWNTRTSFFDNKIGVNLSGQFDPYVYQLISESTNPATGKRSVQQRRLDRYAWNNGQGLGNLRTLSTSISASFSSNKGKGKDKEVNDQGQSVPDGIDESQYGTEEEKEYIRQNPEEYVDFDVPWTFRIQYSISRNQTGFQDPQIIQSMQFSGTVALTEKTQVTYNSGFDFVNKEFTTTRIGIARDLHCWSLNFSWVPFGRYQSFSLVIRPNSSILQDLKLEKRRNFYDFFDR